MKKQDLTGKTVYYADEDCTYEVFVEKEHMSIIEGVVLWEESHYAPATYPHSMIPTLRHVTIDLYHDKSIHEDSIRIYDRSEKTLKKVEEIKRKQAEFKNKL